MAIKVVEDQNVVIPNGKYKATCPRCGAVVEYLGCDVSTHRRYPNGYVYCPKCRCPIPHSHESFTGETMSSIQAKSKQPKNYTGLVIFVCLLFLITVLIIIFLFAFGVFR